MGARQLPPSPTAHLPRQEILSPHVLPAYRQLRGVLSVLHQRLWASMFWFHCHGLQTAIILAHFMTGINVCPLFFILYSVMSLSMSSMFPRGVFIDISSLDTFLKWTQLYFGFLYLTKVLLLDRFKADYVRK